ncbi:metallopeptidase family protein [Roseospirillum parvum]|uniref:Predicted Zn-dependent protease, minimal metalloprotease (MMP)-like domain n=1 Tax=Roseospirillum parvum TaxID=83401 RepID=A0A1G7X2U3_9PROT|nr:metallopeptidase family protein [Roseospirillum parvum]SDG78499.1 Predicted Zn-dependent protease, minimal metalloprotease (MMP)-like domain [Roseospirillum parvum]
MTASRFSEPPGADYLEAVAQAALEALPANIRGRLGSVVVRIEDFCTPEVEAEMGLESPFDLLGLYHGVALTGKSHTDLPQGPDMVFLYRRPILDYWCETGEDLDHLVRHVLIHEIGHHLGFSDEDMERLEAEVGEDGG